jgi:hypothetical protein
LGPSRSWAISAIGPAIRAMYVGKWMPKGRVGWMPKGNLLGRGEEAAFKHMNAMWSKRRALGEPLVNSQ